MAVVRRGDFINQANVRHVHCITLFVRERGRKSDQQPGKNEKIHCDKSDIVTVCMFDNSADIY